MDAAHDASISLHLPPGAQGLVPSGFAEKAMASLMQMHGELMEEKERRVELHRRLMEKEQSLAELRMYVQMLEARMEAPPADPAAARATPPTSAEPIHSTAAAPAPVPEVVAGPEESVAAKAPRAPVQAPRPPAPPNASARRAAVDGWKVW